MIMGFIADYQTDINIFVEVELIEREKLFSEFSGIQREILYWEFLEPGKFGALLQRMKNSFKLQLVKQMHVF